MSKQISDPSPEVFATWVRNALDSLYDSHYLHTHPLAHALTDGNGGTPLYRGQNLRRILIEAIHSLRPSPGTPAQSPDWRAYRLLELRYIEGLPPADVMRQLAFGRSQYFHEQASILQAVVDALWKRWQESQPDVAVTEASSSPREDLLHTEMERLTAHATWEPVDVTELLRNLHAVIDRLALARGTHLHLGPQQPSILYADQVMLRQAILNVVTYVLEAIEGAHVTISSFARGNESGICIQASVPLPSALSALATDTPSSPGNLQTSRRLTEAMGGTLELASCDANRWEARLVWVAVALKTVLVVDDNQGFIDLVRRYLRGRNWQVVGATNAEEARRAIAEKRPTAIILDVMMPKEDGWAFLMALRATDETRNIPVIVCSVLSEASLALSLGATASLPKPVTQQALVRALLPWSQATANLEQAP